MKLEISSKLYRKLCCYTSNICPAAAIGEVKEIKKNRNFLPQASAPSLSSGSGDFLSFLVAHACTGIQISCPDYDPANTASPAAAAAAA